MRPVQARLLRIAMTIAAVGGVLPAASAGVAARATLPQGFYDSDFAVGFAGRLTTMTFAPDGRLFVSEKQGSIRIVRDGTLLPTPFLTLNTNTDTENGLKGIAFDPAFGSNRFVYVYYTDAVTLRNKVSRFTASAADPDLADPNSEHVVVDGIATGTYRTGGALHFGRDGKLYVSTGDASYAPNGQQLANLNGKILRVNKDGTIPADNPFVGQAGKRPEIWAYGLRNPFTFAFQPGTGRMFINDVGQDTWEELNQGLRGANYGWPTCEGACGSPAFVDPIYAYNHADDPGKSITGAVFYQGSMFPAAYVGEYFFGDYVGNYIKRYNPSTGVVTAFATNAPNPVDLDVGPDGAMYYLSVEERHVHRITFGEPTPPPTDTALVSNGGFENAGSAWLSPWTFKLRSPAQAAVARDAVTYSSGSAAARVDVSNPSEAWHVQLMQPGVPLVAGRRHVLRFAARASSNRTIGVSFQRNVAPYPIYQRGSFALTTGWRTFTLEFTPGTTDASALLSFNLGDGPGQIWLDDVELTTSIGQPPAVTITLPQAGTTYRAGQRIAFSGGATDAEDGAVPATRLTWEVVFHHNDHTHPYTEPFSGATSGSFVIADTGESSANVWYRIHLSATDSDGNRVEATRDVTPRTARVTLATQPTGLALELDGTPIVAPHTYNGVVGFRREVAAPTSQTLGGRNYKFIAWSDGGLARHVLATPGASATYTAVYEDVGSNLLANSGFENVTRWPSPWHLNVRAPAAATVARDTVIRRSGSAAARVNVTTSSLDWHVQLNQPGVSLRAGEAHTLSFYARASSSRVVRASFQGGVSPYATYFERTFSLSTGWRRYTVTFTPAASDEATILSFNLGSKTGQVWLDDLALRR